VRRQKENGARHPVVSTVSALDSGNAAVLQANSRPFMYFREEIIA
jgi:hypothetical protein